MLGPAAIVLTLDTYRQVIPAMNGYAAELMDCLLTA
jgi:hypothetical protein